MRSSRSTNPVLVSPQSLSGRSLAVATVSRRSPSRFAERVWAICARIPPGRVATYAQIAALAGCPRAARAVGQALRANPYWPKVPCHRVVGSDGRLTGFSTGLTRKRQLLEAEGVSVRNGKVDLRKYQWKGL